VKPAVPNGVKDEASSVKRQHSWRKIERGDDSTKEGKQKTLPLAVTLHAILFIETEKNVKLQLSRIWRLCMLALMLGEITFLVTGNHAQADNPEAPSSNHCVCRHNAQQKKDVANFGAYAYIQWKKINLLPGNGGTYSYHRVASVQTTPWKYVEFGWIRTTKNWCAGVAIDKYCGLIVYNAGGADLNHAVAITKADHAYFSQYDPNTNKHWFFLDGANVWNINAGFGQGNQVKGGGEVGAGVEQMKDVHLSSLEYLVNNGGNFQFVFWNGYADAEQEAPYSNVDGGPNDFFNHSP